MRTSREFVHALLALHSGYPDLMSNKLFDDHLKVLGSLFRYFAHLQPEFSELSPTERQRLLAQNTPLFLQYVLSAYLKPKGGCEQVRWLLVGKNPAKTHLQKIGFAAMGEIKGFSGAAEVGRYEDAVTKISHMPVELLPMVRQCCRSRAP